MNKVYNFFGGRTATVVWYALITGTALAVWGKLTPTFVSLIVALPGLQALRSIFEDKCNTSSTQS